MSFWKKDTKAEVTEDISVGSAADVEAVMKKYDRNPTPGCGRELRNW